METEGEQQADGSAAQVRGRKALLRGLAPASQVFEGEAPEPKIRRVEETVETKSNEQNLHKELTCLIDAELGKYLNSTVLADIKKESAKLVQRIRSLQKTYARINTLVEEIDLLKNGHLPRSVREVAFSFETELLDHSISQAGLDITVDESASIRDIKKKLHTEATHIQKQIDLQLMGIHRDNLKALIRKTAFISKHGGRSLQLRFWVSSPMTSRRLTSM
ncbi:unnamed protein product [Polarella glacialis]|uniref:Uncharacterized protein n=1 Tax=Polarella glacialis TaxID=89957 RepID=A0A813DYB1_POLGL|nr:unnamed protein product [Polarella glacialis]